LTHSSRQFFSHSAWPASLRLTLGLALFCLIFSRADAEPTEDGLYATVSTSEGTFVIDLAFDEAPITVANFVGLAEGTRGWVDFKTGRTSHEPFYDGLKIPRAESGFVIQFGSPNNTTSGGPGYNFGDEFHPNQRHDEAGIVSMANAGAGTSDTNGSQVFITLAATSPLDNKHSVFGKTVEGLSVVQAIGELPGGTVTINRMTITRIGAAANAFDVTAWGLPVVKESDIALDASNAPSSYFLNFPRKPFTQYYTFDSPTLDGPPGTWEFQQFVLLNSAPQESLDVTARTTGHKDRFFNVTEVEYTPVPASINGTTTELILISSEPNDQLLTMHFTGEPRGTIDYDNSLGTYSLEGGEGPPGTGRIGAYTWTQSLQRGVLGINLEAIGTFFFYQRFRPDGSGSFSGYNSTGSPSGPFPFYGNFTTGPTGLP
jgi:cyclophilin family peptidyl-prolyl cis-trans isomerase